MKKVFIIHGFGAGPNSSWFPWLMTELKKKDIYACALPMPAPGTPVCSEWVNEIRRQVEVSRDDEIYLVGHSLGSAAILNFLQEDKTGVTIAGALLVSGRFKASEESSIKSFYPDFNFDSIKEKSRKFAIIHGENDTRVPVESAFLLGEGLDITPLIIPNAGHLIGSDGVRELPQALQALDDMMN